MTPEAWQAALRRQFGHERRFRLKNVGTHPLFSEFQVTNPQSRRTYRVAIRGSEPGSNFCACPDFATNTLGTCKHIEFTLGRLVRKPGARAAFARGWAPPFSEVYLRYGARREVRFRPGAGASDEFKRFVARYFDAEGVLRPDAFGRFDAFVTKAVRFDPDLRCYEDAPGFVAQVRDAERRSRLVNEAFSRGIRSAALGGLLRVELYDYQREAALFAARAGRSGRARATSRSGCLSRRSSIGWPARSKRCCRACARERVPQGRSARMTWPSREPSLRAAIAREESRLASLEEERTRVQAKLDALRFELASLHGKPNGASSRDTG